MVRETRHLWVGNLPESVDERQVINFFSRYGRVESVRILPRRAADGGRAAFVDFVDIKSAVKAHESKLELGSRELRSNYNEPGSRFVSAAQHHNRLSGGDSRDNGGSGWRRGGGDDGDYSRSGGGGAPLSPSGRNDRWSGGHQKSKYQSHSRHRIPSDSGPHYKRGGVGGGARSASRSMSPPLRTWSPKRRDAAGETQDMSWGGSQHSGGGTGSGGEKPTNCLLIENLDQHSSEKGIFEGLHHECKKLSGYLDTALDKRGGILKGVIKFQSATDAYHAKKELIGRKFHGNRLKVSFREEIGGSDKGGDYHHHHQHQHRDRGGVVSASSSATGNHHGSRMIDDDEEYSMEASRTLWVGNLERRFTPGDVKKLFNQHCRVLDVDVKDRQQPFNYAFVRFASIREACRIKRKFERYTMGETRLRIGFSRQPPTNGLWLDNIGFATSERYILRQFSRFGRIVEVYVDKYLDTALIVFERVDEAERANEAMRGMAFSRGGRLKIDFANNSSQKEFVDDLTDQFTHVFGPGHRRDDSPPLVASSSRNDDDRRRERRKQRSKANNDELASPPPLPPPPPPPPRSESEGDERRDREEEDDGEEEEGTRRRDHRKYQQYHHHRHHHRRHRDEEEEEEEKEVDEKKRKREKRRSRDEDVSEHKRRRDSDGGDDVVRHKRRQFNDSDRRRGRDDVDSASSAPPPPEKTFSPLQSDSRHPEDENVITTAESAAEDGEINMEATEPVKGDEQAAEYSSDRVQSDPVFSSFNSQLGARPEPEATSAAATSSAAALTAAAATDSISAAMTAYAAAAATLPAAGVLSAQIQPPDIPQLLLQRYPVVWQGHLALKDHLVAVQMHYLAGNRTLGEVSLPRFPVPSLVPSLKIVQRMRLDPSQLDGVAKRMQSETEHCILLALPCGRDPLDVHCQTKAMRTDFIHYLQQKQAAGIVNMKPPPGSSYPGEYVLHIFPPCDFTQAHLSQCALDLLENTPVNGHLMIVVATM